MAKKLGYQAELYYGPKGLKAPNKLECTRDITYDTATEQGETTCRGDGLNPPIVTQGVTAIVPTITFQMINDTQSLDLAALIAAARTGVAVALRYVDRPEGDGGVGYDGDMVLTVSNGAPYKGEQTFDFVGSANDDDRAPQLNV